MTVGTVQHREHERRGRAERLSSRATAFSKKENRKCMQLDLTEIHLKLLRITVESRDHSDWQNDPKIPVYKCTKSVPD